MKTDDAREIVISIRQRVKKCSNVPGDAENLGQFCPPILLSLSECCRCPSSWVQLSSESNMTQLQGPGSDLSRSSPPRKTGNAVVRGIVRNFDVLQSAKTPIEEPCVERS